MTKQKRSKEQKSASLKWHMAHDYLLPVVNSHIKILKHQLSYRGLSEDERYEFQTKLEAWNELKKEMS